jgi:hypothetical protein
MRRRRRPHSFIAALRDKEILEGAGREGRARTRANANRDDCRTAHLDPAKGDLPKQAHQPAEIGQLW